MKRLACALLAAVVLPAVADATDTPVPTGPAPAHAGPTLREAVNKDDLRIGTSFVFVPGTYREVALREFNLLTPENALKWEVLRPDQGSFNFEYGDALAKLALAHGMKLRGHTLVWHRQLPDWLVNGAFTRDQMIEILRHHITKVVRHYRKRFPHTVYQWDVVNEAVEDCPGPARCGLRRSIWLDRIGPEYIELAFRFAHSADPNAELYYNDYAYEATDTGAKAKAEGVLRLVSWLRSRGVPVQGVGLQLHETGAGPPQDYLQALMGRIAALGVDVAVTELDIGTVAPGQTHQRPQAVLSAADLEQQAKAYAGALDACLHQPRCHTFVMWGFSDAVNWRMPDQACIFDRDYQPKPAYFALRDRLLLGRTP